MKLIDILVQELPKRGGWPEGVYSISQFPSGELCYHDEGNNCSNANTSVYLTKHEDGDDTDWAYGVYITREQYEVALAAKNDGWIEWGGGECPVDTKTLVDIRLKVGFTYKSCYPGDYSWRHAGGGGDIIAYRLHKPQEVTKADDEADLNECIGQTPAPVWSGEGLPPVGCECEVSVDGGRSWCTYRAINEKNGARLIEIGNFTEEFQNNNWIFRPIRSQAERKREEAVQALCDAGGGNGKVDEKAGYGSCWFGVYDAIAAGKVRGVKLED